MIIQLTIELWFLNCFGRKSIIKAKLFKILKNKIDTYYIAHYEMNTNVFLILTDVFYIFNIFCISFVWFLFYLKLIKIVSFLYHTSDFWHCVKNKILFLEPILFNCHLKQLIWEIKPSVSLYILYKFFCVHYNTTKSVVEVWNNLFIILIYKC